MKLEIVEWFEGRIPEIARTPKASDRKKKIEKLKNSNPVLYQKYEQASKKAKKATSLARNSNDYPLLAKGDINIYSLFVERAHRLIKPTGRVVLIVPSGIYSAVSNSEFFSRISKRGQLFHLYDFKNNKSFFPDVGKSEKFCMYHYGGYKCTTENSELAFFLNSTDDLNNTEKVFFMTDEDFRRVNPNTGTAPIFRNRRDARIVNAIYEKFPVLSHEEKGMAYPVKYYTMFHMTNDSHLFHTKDELEKAGFYPTKGGVWKRGENDYFASSFCCKKY